MDWKISSALVSPQVDEIALTDWWMSPQRRTPVRCERKAKRLRGFEPFGLMLASTPAALPVHYAMLHPYVVGRSLVNGRRGRPPPTAALRPTPSGRDVTNIRATHDVPFCGFAVMSLRPVPVAAAQRPSSSPPVSPDRHTASSRAGHCLDNNPNVPYRRDAAGSSSSASPCQHSTGGSPGLLSPASHTPRLC